MAQKKIHLEALRVLAIIFVVFNHTPAFGFPLSANADASWSELFMLCTSIADKIAVPVFFMISGALLLAKKEALSVLLKKRVLRMLIVLMIFLLAQNAFSYFSETLTLKQAAGNILKGDTPAPATWFLYAYLGFLLMLPLLRLLVEKMETQHFIYLVALHVILVEFIPVSHTPLTPLNGWLPLTALHGNLINIYPYALLGYYLEHRVMLRDISKKAFVMLVSASLFAILIGALLTMSPLLISGHAPSEYRSCFLGAILIPCIFIYLASRKLSEIPLPKWFICMITLLGSGCFTVMLTENIFRVTIASHVSGYKTEYVPSLLVTLMVCCCGWFCGIIAKRIPWIKNLV